MDLAELVREHLDDLAGTSLTELRQAKLEHYEADGTQATRQRFARLLELMLECLEERRADPIVEYAAAIGRERFEAGYGLLEVQTAINILEEALWKRVLASVEPNEIARALGLVNALLGAAKDTLARTYVTLATNRTPPIADLEGLPEKTEID